MFVELLIGASLVALGAATARRLAKRRQDAEEERRRLVEDRDPKKKKADAPEEPKKEKKKRGPRRSRVPRDSGPRGLRVADVILHADTEMWLAGMLELDEEGLVARLFVTPGAARSSWLAQLDPEATDLATLAPTEEVPDGPVPERLPIGGRRLTLERRGHAEVRSEGEHLPRTNARGRWTLLSDATGRVLFVLDFEKAPRLALVGDRLPTHMIDLLPGGDLE